ncbi:hypothetical protein CKQ90_30035 [Klebsiella pneumoniae]|nr:hypothetical protein CKQ90_30035 [Klebsiella pneumoniae]
MKKSLFWLLALVLSPVAVLVVITRWTAKAVYFEIMAKKYLRCWVFILAMARCTASHACQGVNFLQGC